MLINPTCKSRIYYQAMQHEFLPCQRMVSPYEAYEILEIIKIMVVSLVHAPDKKLVTNSQTKLCHKGK